MREGRLLSLLRDRAADYERLTGIEPALSIRQPSTAQLITQRESSRLELPHVTARIMSWSTVDVD